MRSLVVLSVVSSLLFATAMPAMAQVSDPVRNPVDGHYYEAVTVPGGISWSDARDAAESRFIGVVQGHLATITSEEESDFIVASFPELSAPQPPAYWLGGFQPPGSPEPGGNWQWVTGEPFVYTNWAPSEPNDHSSPEQCMNFTGDFSSPGQWNDQPCGGEVGYLVEYDVSGAFADDDNSIFEPDIEWLVDQGITQGCTADGTLYCPDDNVTRGQMAAFLARAFNLPDAGPSPFTDTAGSIFEADIAKVAAAGITQGCNPEGTLFCPNGLVTRGQMAAFLSRGLVLPEGAVNTFVDDDGSIFEEDIAKIAQGGITQGCTADGTMFCPDDFVNRGQMAAFIHRALE